jgi:hypothetical protein
VRGSKRKRFRRRNLIESGHDYTLLVTTSKVATNAQDGYKLILRIITLVHLRDFVEVFSDEFLLLDELDVGQTFGGEFNRLVEAVLTPIRHVDELEVNSMIRGTLNG